MKSKVVYLYQIRETQIKGVIKMFKKITKEFLEENDMELERLLKKEFEDELEQQN